MKNNQLLKICSSCKQELEIIHFNKNKSSKDGLNNQCKECFKISAKKCYDNKKEKGLLRFQIKDEKYKASRKNDAIKYKEKIAEYKKEYRENNKEFLKETKRKYYEENKEKINLKNRIYHHNNKDRLNKISNKYYNENKEIIRQKSKDYYNSEKGKLVFKKARIKRKALVRKAKIGDIDLNKIISNKKCYWCNTKIMDNNYHIDHYIPISKGGEHSNDNLVLSCPKCNLTKGAKDPFIFANSIGRLL